MSDFFEIVEQQLRDAAPALAPGGRAVPPPRRRRHGAAIAIAAGAAVAVAVFVAGLLLVGSGGDGSGQRGARPGVPLAEWHDTAHGLSVRYPATWHRAPSSLTPHLVDPVEILSLGTYPLRPGPAGSCAQVPVAALRAAGPRDVFLTLQERVVSDHAHFPPRTRPLAIGPALRTEVRGCVGRHAAWTEHLTSFSDAGRQFSLLTIVGDAATPARRAELQAVLDSLRVTPGHAPSLPARR